jgi:aldehyde:ferredoxin oxidoreductase
LNAYHQRVLLANASTRTARTARLTSNLYAEVLGGSGLGTLLALATDQPSLSPDSPATAVIFSFSPLVGSPLTTSAKFTVTCRSPLTGMLNDSMASSRFAILGKQTGFDALIVSGVASEPCVILIDEGGVSFQSANELWGLSCSESEAALRCRFGSDYAYAVIGPAGENGVRFASVSHDGRHAGRGGTGAILGLKNIKAIGVRGRARVAWADEQGLRKAARKLAAESWGAATAKYRELGTLSNLLTFNRLQTLPTRNFQESSFTGAERLSVESMDSKTPAIRSSCAACTIGCEHIYPSGSDASQGVRLEYESVFALGPLCGIDDPQIVTDAVHRCNEWGLDTISMGGTLALAMECSDRGWLPQSELGFGQGTTLLKAIDQTALREGLGDQLAEGSQRLAASLGPQATAIAMHVKGLELPGYDLRKLKSLAVGLAVCARGADHNRSGAYEADFAALAPSADPAAPSIALNACETEDRSAAMDSLILCKFVRGCLSDFWSDCGELLSMTTGHSWTAQALHQTARRIIDMKKLFNERAGWTSADDCLPARFFSDAPENPGTLSRAEFQSHVRDYYRQRNWNDQGRLSPQATASIASLIKQTRQSLELRPSRSDNGLKI